MSKAFALLYHSYTFPANIKKGWRGLLLWIFSESEAIVSLMEQTPPPYPPKHTMTVILEPEGKELIIPWCKTVWQLLEKFSLGVNAALVIRENALLTPDRSLSPNDIVTLRIVTSSG